jgi:hypothetical protein
VADRSDSGVAGPFNDARNVADGGPVIDDDGFPVGKGLGNQADQGIAKTLGIIEARDDNAARWRGSLVEAHHLSTVAAVPAQTSVPPRVTISAAAASTSSACQESS